tara:strand:+ start:237 stop:740 length:504 start_codon:yes stop_codon:yes gene_type:complete
MKSKENIVFLGMMGSGKSSIGSLVSKKLKLNFFDIDRQIENELGMKISKIFETKGEKFFRDLEEKVTLRILKKNEIVISLGGGTFMNTKVRKEILNNHLSFWLQWNDEILLNRIKNSAKRPIAIQSSNNELLDLIKKRSSIYSRARYKINCNNLTKTEIVEKVVKYL